MTENGPAGRHRAHADPSSAVFRVRRPGLARSVVSATLDAVRDLVPRGAIG